MDQPNEPANVWTDEMIDAAIAADAAARGDWKPVAETGLVSYGDENPTKMRRFFSKCPLCAMAINPEWLPEIERFQFECTKPQCRYTKRLGSAGYRRLLDQMTDANGKPIPGKGVTLPV